MYVSEASWFKKSLKLEINKILMDLFKHLDCNEPKCLTVTPLGFL